MSYHWINNKNNNNKKKRWNQKFLENSDRIGPDSAKQLSVCLTIEALLKTHAEVPCWTGAKDPTVPITSQSSEDF